MYMNGHDLARILAIFAAAWFVVGFVVCLLGSIGGSTLGPDYHSRTEARIVGTVVGLFAAVVAGAPVSLWVFDLTTNELALVVAPLIGGAVSMSVAWYITREKLS
jgi:hypothetical protein